MLFQIFYSRDVNGKHIDKFLIFHESLTISYVYDTFLRYYTHCYTNELFLACKNVMPRSKFQSNIRKFHEFQSRHLANDRTSFIASIREINLT